MASIADSGNYAARATAIRETAKWIAAIFAGAGAVLFSGLSFANVAQAARSEDWVLPVLLAAVPVLAAAWAIREAAAVITAEPPETRALLGALGSEEELDQSARAAVEKLRPAVVATYGGLEQFDARLRAANEKVDVARRLYSSQPRAERQAELDQAYRELDALQEGVRDVVLAADYARVKARYATARWHLLAAATLATAAAAGAGVLAGEAQREEAQAANPALDQGPTPLRFKEPTSVRVFLNVDPASPKFSSPCPISNRKTALAIGGTYTRPLLLVEHSKSQSGSTSCSRAWTWAPKRGEVVVVPVPSAHD